MANTSLTIGDLTIYEPMTAFTDYIIAGIAFYFYLKLISNDPVIHYWSYFFLFIALSTALGGTSHGFFPVHDGWQYKSFWLPMQISNGFAVYFAQKATLLSVLKDSSSYN